MTRFNIQNSGNLTGHYPLFLGEEPGLIDNINVSYPEIADYRDKLLANGWKWDEISLAKDFHDIQNPELKAEVDIMVKTLSFQLAADSVASRSIYDLLGAQCTNPELQGLLQFWSWNEYVHAQTYSEINKIAFKDSNQLIEETKENQNVIKRLAPIAEQFAVMDEINKQGAYRADVMKHIIQTISALTVLEAISFTGSFASTFALVDATGKFDGIGKNVQLIAKDEMLHTEIDIALLRILRREEENAYADAYPFMQDILEQSIQLEREWSAYLFSEGRQIIGLNEELLNDYILYLSYPVFKELGCLWIYRNVSENPLPWMSRWLELDKVQVAAQESQIVNYQANAAKEDLDDFDFDF